MLPENPTETYLDGPVYQVQILTKTGIILRSTPMTAQEADAFIEAYSDDHAIIGMRALDRTDARVKLLEDSEQWRHSGELASELLVHVSDSFSTNIVEALAHAGKLADRAASIA